MQTPESAGPAASYRLALSAEETAARLGISRQSVYEGMRTGSIPSLKIGRRIIVPLSSLEQMLKECVAVEGGNAA